MCTLPLRLALCHKISGHKTVDGHGNRRAYAYFASQCAPFGCLSLTQTHTLCVDIRRAFMSEALQFLLTANMNYCWHKKSFEYASEK